ncbi:MAG: L,D-transpeptidase family protein [Thermodesulfobacteriota bacterium]
MNKANRVMTIGVIFLAFFTPTVFAQYGISQHIHQLLQSGATDTVLTCGKERICGVTLIPRFYNNRGYQPAWIDSQGHFNPTVQALMGALKASDEEGLLPEIYHLEQLEALFHETKKEVSSTRSDHSPKLAELDILLTDAFLLYATHLRSGRVNPETIHTAWIAYHPEVDLNLILTLALDRNRISETLSDLSPPHSGYRRLKEALKAYRLIAQNKGWPNIPTGPALRPRDNDDRAPLLRQRLILSRDLSPSFYNESIRYDESLEHALKQFQRRHGLEPDGVLGKNTLTELNIPVEQRIRQLELNLERWRWIPHNLGQRYLLVNIADFLLEVIESGQRVMDMRVVVGKEYRRTPVFSETMKYIVLNPFWEVPLSIATKDKLPLIQKDPEYLLKNNFRVFIGWEENAREIDPGAIDWSTVGRHNFIYRLRQDPGPENALGRIKFMFPNRFAVYLHHTPSHELFDRTVRTFSSGCIRVEKPLDLAAYVLDDHSWTKQQIQKVMDTGENRTIILRNPIPVHLLYWTSWIDSDGMVHFREDIYDRDIELNQALKEKLPPP